MGARRYLVHAADRNVRAPSGLELRRAVPFVPSDSRLLRSSKFGLRSSNYALFRRLPLSPWQSPLPALSAAARAPLFRHATFPNYPID
jgi:hypothetical protein